MPFKSKVKISQNLVAFSEYMNFTIGADSSAEYNPNAPEFIGPIFLPKSLVFQWKNKLHFPWFVRGILQSSTD